MIEQTVKLRVGGFGNLEDAERQISDFRTPDVFTARSVIFPNPRNYDMRAAVNDAQIIAVDTGDPFNTHAIDMDVVLTAPNAEKLDSWIASAEQNLKAWDPRPIVRHGSER